MKQLLIFLSVAMIGAKCAGVVVADDQLADVEASSDEQQRLDILQQALKNDYDRLEKKLLELAEYTSRTDPDRAQLLMDVRSESISRRISSKMQRITQSLTPSDEGDVLYGDALSGQEELLTDLAALIKLLQSEDERDRIDAEITRIQDLLKDTNRIIGQQKDVRADTERGGKAGELQSDQQKVAEQAERLAEKINEQDAERQSDSGGEPQDSDSQERDPSDREPSEKESDTQESEQSESENSEDGGQSKSGESSEGESSESESSEEQQPSQGHKQQGQQQQGQPQQGQPQPGQQQQEQQQQQSEQTPGREQLEQAREQMQKAIEQLQQQKLDEASDAQDGAIAKLEEMKAELEEILRQLREEERKMMLAQLEARFQRMLELQLNINNGTLKLDRIPPEERDDDRHLAQSTKLSRDEQKNRTEAEKVLMLLKEEGSSVAFPEAVGMMIDNMDAVSSRLQRGQTAETTQLLERLIVESLEEMIFALQREMEKQDQQQPGEGQQGQPSEQELIDQLAQLKMIRSLQLQINRLTLQYGNTFEGEQADDPDAFSFLRKLSRRQGRLQEATYDLSIGKNK